MKQIIEKIQAGEDLSLKESIEAAEKLSKEKGGTADAATFLTCLAVKGYSVNEILGFAQYARQHTHKLNPYNKELVIDIVGTGADRSNTFNISTATAFVVAGAGVPVAKYGNKAISSASGSSDVLEALGINIYQDFDKIEGCIENIGLAFMNAQQFNTSFRNISELRKAMTIPTIFNLVGPLTNPVQPNYIAMGVFEPRLTEIVANVARELNYERGLFFHGCGLDEVTNTGITSLTELIQKGVINYDLDPLSFKINYGQIEDLQVNTKDESASIILDILDGKEQGHKRDIVLLNAAAALYITGKAGIYMEGIQLAKESIDSGKALKKLYAVRDFMK